MDILHLEILVEEYSAEVMIQSILPKILPEQCEFEIRSFRGKADLLKQLPRRLKGYRSWMPDDWRIVVLCDCDQEDCQKLKKKLEDYAILAGFTTKSSCNDSTFTVVNRIAIEELESWLLGDAKAVNQAYPKISINFIQRKRYREPDQIKGGTWEALEDLLQKKGYHQGGLNKVQAARDISKYMKVNNNLSKSFHCFYTGVQSFWQDTLS